MIRTKRDQMFSAGVNMNQSRAFSIPFEMNITFRSNKLMSIMLV